MQKCLALALTLFDEVFIAPHLDPFTGAWWGQQGRGFRANVCCCMNWPSCRRHAVEWRPHAVCSIQIALLTLKFPGPILTSCAGGGKRSKWRNMLRFDPLAKDKYGYR
eukprot:GHUV01049221.1.p1 GENE.GHUV01049221.1~~GHUV01049221.1.p1  ORF type:complete len:108 (-),score=5.70 GHUV01049221.1:59-382(-)